MTTLLVILTTLLCVFFADWPWRSHSRRAAGAFLRIAVTCLLASNVYMNAHVGIGRAWRRAVSTDDRVTSAPPALPSMTPYMSGVTTMRREVARDIDSIHPSLLGLLLLGVSPVLRLHHRRRDS